ncbi:MAG: DUF1801 domain-containing protein [Caldilineaceae bacterium]
MHTNQSTPTPIDEYIAGQPPEIQQILQQIRQTIQQAAPEAAEAISYQLPTFKLQGNLVHFGAFKKHIGFYPAPSGLEQFKAELAAYKGAKGSVQFPLDQPMPLDLIRRITEFRVGENLAKATAKKSKPQRPQGPTTATASPQQTVGQWPNGVAAPAQRALAAAGYTSLEQLAAVTETELLDMHGMGPKALGVLRAALQAQGLAFAQE